VSERSNALVLKTREPAMVPRVRPVIRLGAPSNDGANPKPFSNYFNFMYHVYFLRLSDDNIYKGSTSDLKRRYLEH